MTDRPAAPWARRAWFCLAATVPALVAAMVLGEGLQAAFGYPDATPEATPWWVKLVAAGTAGLVMMVPSAIGSACARRGRRRGEGRPARTAAIANLVVLILLAAQLVLSLGASLLG